MGQVRWVSLVGLGQVGPGVGLSGLGLDRVVSGWLAWVGPARVGLCWFRLVGAGWLGQVSWVRIVGLDWVGSGPASGLGWVWVCVWVWVGSGWLAWVGQGSGWVVLG